jgi:hypothetical protein
MTPIGLTKELRDLGTFKAFQATHYDQFIQAKFCM